VTSSGMMRCKSGGSSTSSACSESWVRGRFAEFEERSILKKLWREGFEFAMAVVLKKKIEPKDFEAGQYEREGGQVPMSFPTQECDQNEARRFLGDPCFRV
jgi:hypothetical protein